MRAVVTSLLVLVLALAPPAAGQGEPWPPAWYFGENRERTSGPAQARRLYSLFAALGAGAGREQARAAALVVARQKAAEKRRASLAAVLGPGTPVTAEAAASLEWVVETEHTESGLEACVLVGYPVEWVDPGRAWRGLEGAWEPTRAAAWFEGAEGVVAEYEASGESALAAQVAEVVALRPGAPERIALVAAALLERQANDPERPDDVRARRDAAARRVLEAALDRPGAGVEPALRLCALHQRAGRGVEEARTLQALDARLRDGDPAKDAVRERLARYAASWDVLAAELDAWAARRRANAPFRVEAAVRGRRLVATPLGADGRPEATLPVVWLWLDADGLFRVAAAEAGRPAAFEADLDPGPRARLVAVALRGPRPAWADGPAELVLRAAVEAGDAPAVAAFRAVLTLEEAWVDVVTVEPRE